MFSADLSAAEVRMGDVFPEIEPHDHGMLDVGHATGSTGRCAATRWASRRYPCAGTR